MKKKDTDKKDAPEDAPTITPEEEKLNIVEFPEQDEDVEARVRMSMKPGTDFSCTECLIPCGKG